MDAGAIPAPLSARLDELLKTEKSLLIVGVDGPSGSGKSTLAALLAERYECTVFHADDFFLRASQRTARRLSEPGGNLDRERLRDEILLPLRRSKPAVYRPFFCVDMDFLPSCRPALTRLNVVEGAYCLHPELAAFYDLRVFSNAEERVRYGRLEVREKDGLLEFLNRWLPMEQAYFSKFTIAEAADITVELN